MVVELFNELGTNHFYTRFLNLGGAELFSKNWLTWPTPGVASWDEAC